MKFNRLYEIVTLSLESEQTLEITGYKFVYVKDATDVSTYIDIYGDNLNNPPVRLTKQNGIVVGEDVERFIIKTAVQPGKSITLFYSVDFSTFRLFEQAATQDINSIVSITNPITIAKPSSRAIYNVTCTAAGTEYSQALPSNVQSFLIRARGGDLKLSFTSGQSGTTYLSILENSSFGLDDVKFSSLTLYFQSTTAGAVAEIVAFS